MKNDDGFCGFRQDNEWTPTPSLDKSLRKALTTNKNIISLIDEIYNKSNIKYRKNNEDWSCNISGW